MPVRSRLKVISPLKTRLFLTMVMSIKRSLFLALNIMTSLNSRLLLMMATSIEAVLLVMATSVEAMLRMPATVMTSLETGLVSMSMTSVKARLLLLMAMVLIMVSHCFGESDTSWDDKKLKYWKSCRNTTTNNTCNKIYECFNNYQCRLKNDTASKYFCEVYNSTSDPRDICIKCKKRPEYPESDGCKFFLVTQKRWYSLAGSSLPTTTLRGMKYIVSDSEYPCQSCFNHQSTVQQIQVNVYRRDLTENITAISLIRDDLIGEFHSEFIYAPKPPVDTPEEEEGMDVFLLVGIVLAVLALLVGAYCCFFRPAWLCSKTAPCCGRAQKKASAEPDDGSAKTGSTSSGDVGSPKKGSKHSGDVGPARRGSAHSGDQEAGEAPPPSTAKHVSAKPEERKGLFATISGTFFKSGTDDISSAGSSNDGASQISGASAKSFGDTQSKRSSIDSAGSSGSSGSSSGSSGSKKS